MMRKLSIAAAICVMAFNLSCVKPDESANEGRGPSNSNARGNQANRDSGVSDPLITAKIKLALLLDERTSGLETDVDTNGGAVTLSGKVDTDEAKTAAEEVAKKVDGVRSVNSLLQVVPEARRKEVAASDDKVDAAIEDLMDDDAIFEDITLSAKTNAGVVTLNGTVDTQKELVSAAQAIRKVPGVKAVDATQVTVRDEKKP